MISKSHLTYLTRQLILSRNGEYGASDNLTNRKACVHYNGYCSKRYVIASDVPQGSNLGPLLFLVAINPLLDMFTCKVLAYADESSVMTLKYTKDI